MRANRYHSADNKKKNPLLLLLCMQFCELPSVNLTVWLRIILCEQHGVQGWCCRSPMISCLFGSLALPRRTIGENTK